MVKHILFLVVVVCVLGACDDVPKRVLPRGKYAIIPEKEFPKDREMTIDIPPPPAPYTGPKQYCFEMELGKDANEKVKLKFVLEDNDSIFGQLDYNYTSREPLHGTVEGLREGTFIELIYAFTDSGLTKRELLVLKMDGDKLYKKNGALVENNGIWILENPLISRLELFVIQTECK